jgi:hypothetical protein
VTLTHAVDTGSAPEHQILGIRQLICVENLQLHKILHQIEFLLELQVQFLSSQAVAKGTGGTKGECVLPLP